MNKYRALISGIVLSMMAAIVFAQQSMMDGKDMMGMMNMSMARHRYVMRNGVPSDYSSRKNPIPANEERLRDGRMLYETNCSTCHGATGQGDGPAGTNLNPRPSNLARFIRMPMATDPYLFWTISDGGAPIQSAMPPFKTALSEKEVWEIIVFLRTM